MVELGAWTVAGWAARPKPRHHRLEAAVRSVVMGVRQLGEELLRLGLGKPLFE